MNTRRTSVVLSTTASLYPQQSYEMTFSYQGPTFFMEEAAYRRVLYMYKDSLDNFIRVIKNRRRKERRDIKSGIKNLKGISNLSEGITNAYHKVQEASALMSKTLELLRQADDVLLHSNS